MLRSRFLSRINHKLVRVGCAVIAASTHDRVRGLVFVAALAPDEGETVADVFYRAEPKGLSPLFDWMSHYDVFWRQRFRSPPTDSDEWSMLES